MRTCCRARGPRISAQKRALAEQIKEEELRQQQQQRQENEDAETDSETECRWEVTHSKPKTTGDTEAAPLVAPENKEEFQLLVSQWLEEGKYQDQQQQQQA